MDKRGFFITAIFLSLFILPFISAAIINVPADHSNIQAAIGNASAGDVINVSDGTYVEIGQIVIDKDISIIGVDKETTIIKTDQDTSSSGDDRGWFLVNDGIDFILDNITLDGDGFKIWQAIRHKGTGSVSNCIIKNIKFDESGPSYSGLGMAVFGSPSGNVDVTNCEFSEIGRIGVLYFGTGVTDSVFSGNTYTGKGDGDFLDYGVEVGAGANVLIENNLISDNRGEASSDGSTSAAVLVTTFFGSGTEATILNNILKDSTTGIAAGFDGTDTSEVEAHYNYITGNSEGVFSTNPLVNATYNWWGDCLGPFHPTTNSLATGDEVSDDVLFDPWTGVCITDKINPICGFETEDITLSANVTSLESILDINTVWMSYDINGINFNKTATNIGDIYSITINSSELVGGKDVDWTAYANDTSGFIFRNGLETFYVRNKTSLTVDPLTPDGLNGWYVTEPEFSLFKDSNGTAIHYIWDTHPDGPILYNNPFGLEDIPNAPPKESAGIVDLNWWSTFSCGNETTQTEFFHVDLTNPSVIPLSPLDGSTVFNNQRPTISARLEETFAQNSGIDIEIAQMSLTGTPAPLVVGESINQTGIDAMIKLTPAFDLPLGENNVTIDVTDNAGRNSVFTWFFTINQTPALTMVVHSPENKTYNTRRIPFNISLDGDVKILQYINYHDNKPRFRTLCRNCDEYGFDRTKTKSLREGENKVGIRATDNLGAVNEVNVSLFIDSKDPRILRTEPRRNKVTNGSDFYIKYTEDNVKELLLSWNPTEDLTSQCNESGINQECFFDIDLTSFDGQEIEYFFNMTDIANNTDSSRVTKVLVDTTDPVINSFNHPIDRRRVEFDINITEINFDEVNFIDHNDKNPREKRLCSRLRDGICEKKRSFKKGEHNLTIIVLDDAGNSDSRNLSFTIS